MIPPQPKHSILTIAEWRAAFRPRTCARDGCGKKIIPAERTTSPSTALRITTCSKACQSAYARARRTPEQKARDAQTAAARFQQWIADEKNYEHHIANTTKTRRKRRQQHLLSSVPPVPNKKTP